MGSSAHAKSIATEEVILTDVAEDVAEDVHVVQLEVSARHKEADDTATLTAIARTRGENVKHAQKDTRKRPPSQIWWEDHHAIVIDS